MSKRNRKPAAAATGGPGRSVQIRVDKPKPWGTIAISVLLAAALIGIIGYAVANTGSGARNIAAEGDSIPGIEITPDSEITRAHVNGPVDYEQIPPNSGDHAPLWQTCAVYNEPIAAEHAVHSLEHGAVWVTYSPRLLETEIRELERKVEGVRYRLMSPLPEQDSPLILIAWGRTLRLESADDPRVDQFLNIFTNGPQTPERGAPCEGGVSTNELVSAEQ